MIFFLVDFGIFVFKKTENKKIGAQLAAGGKTSVPFADP